METIIGTDVGKAAEYLQNGSVIGIPTETVYGLAGNALDANTVLKIFTVKGRPHFDPLIIHTHSIEQIKKFAHDIPPAAQRVLEVFSPGPITVLLPKRPIVPDLVTSGLNTAAFRIPAHPLTLRLLQMIDFPLAAPSANPFGYISPTTSYHVYDQLHGRIPYILDGGATSVGVESTIVGFEDERTIVYRLGGLTVEALEKVAGHVELRINASSDPQAPGQLKSHYAPRKKLILCASEEELIAKAQGQNAGVIAFDKRIPGISHNKQLLLSPNGDMREAAKNLFAVMREMDHTEVEVILALKVEDAGLGRAINDRLQRASA